MTNYHAIQLAGRADDDCLSFSDDLDGSSPSAEDAVLKPIFDMEIATKQTAVSDKIKHLLTRTQYRRIKMYYIDKLCMEQIADLEGVSTPRIYECLKKAERIIVKNL